MAHTSARTLRGAMPSSRPGPHSPSSSHAEQEPSAPGTLTTYVCPDGHHTTVRLYVEAVPPSTWDCKHCRQVAMLPGSAVEAVVANRHEPAHPGAWYSAHHRDQVFGRRTKGELQDLLDERLALLRSSRVA